MRSSRTLLVVGLGLLFVAGLSLVTGVSAFPWIYLAALLLGAIALTAGLVLARRETPPEPAALADPDNGERLVRIAAIAMAVLGASALIVALLVPESEAKNHAIGHFVTGLVCAGLFAALAFPWHPRSGTGGAMFRGIVLWLLAAAAIGGFAESLGGSGYDAANEGQRIQALTTVHNLVAPFGALMIGAVPLGVATCVVLIALRSIRRRRATA